MKITVLGTRGEIEVSAPYHAKKSGVLINDELLLDCGEHSFLDYQPQALLITHLHPDHAYFVRHHETPVLPMPIYAPEKYDGMKITVTNKPFTVGDYHVTPIPTIHSLKVRSNAHLIAHANKKIIYTGDMIWINKEYRHLLTSVDLVITEASFMRKGGMIRRNKEGIFGHTGVPNLIHLFKQYTKHMLFVHFGSWFYEDMKLSRAAFKFLARENDIAITVGYDGLTLMI